MPLSWHALAKCGRLKQGSPCFSQDHWQIPWISLSIRWIEVRRCAERPCCDLQGDWVCSVAAARVVQDVVVCGVFPVLADEHSVRFLRVSTFRCGYCSCVCEEVEKFTVYNLKSWMRIAKIGVLGLAAEWRRVRFRGFVFKLQVCRSFDYGASGSSNPAGACSRLGPDPWSLSKKQFLLLLGQGLRSSG